MTVVWVANRVTPLADSVGTLKVTGSGSLVLLNANGSEIWSSNSSTDARNPVAQLLDSGNLVVKDVDGTGSGNFTYKIDPNGFPQSLLRQGSVVKFRLGPWNGVRYSGMPNLDPNPYYSYEFVLDDDEIYYHLKAP
ncbi:G-type lectin S-receptor-like serine/threonine-protein kinase At4g27290 [Eucalyptus grandis]|uniref:G-type lectin S-receptor-like serine/threonine-protein kinase At4g27290 n=1 Tax=Eucalyptus grandis TaxID=71139 RepID=UPI00192E9B24|nr:G-type lectin S-receptor-like serine/threonine-protein kinase At4g27290 [Eucalyptus grandis]